jgi:predicted component of type VI protein secretion system
MAPASKHAWALKKLGFDIQANKNGREVVSYTMLTAPAVAPVGKPVKAAKPVKAPKPQKVAKAPAKAPKPIAPLAVAAAKKASPTKARKFGPANKTGRSEIIGGSNDDGSEFENVTELNTESEDLSAVIASLRA